MHIPDKTLENFSDNDKMNTDEMIAFLEHLEQCDFCLEQMIAEESKSAETSAPVYLSEQILQRAAAPDIQAVQMVKKTSRRMQLFYYGLRTATGVIAALFLLFTVQSMDFSVLRTFSYSKTQEYSADTKRENPSANISRFTEHMNSEFSRGLNAGFNYIEDFSNKLFNGGFSK